MKKIFILSMLLILSCGYAYGGEIIRLTNNNVNDACPIVNAQGHVFWRQQTPEVDWLLYCYDGTNITKLTNKIMPNSLGYSHQTVVDGNSIVYFRGDYSPTGGTEEIYLFDGQKEIQITNNNFTDQYPCISNGYIAWEGETIDDRGNKTTEIYLYKPDQPTAVQMSSLKATPANKQVKVEWQSESEIDNAGFNVWRAEGFQKVNGSLLPAEGSSVTGADYDFFDKWVMNGKLYYYLVEDIDNNGISTFHGPVKATPRWIYGAGK